MTRADSIFRLEQEIEGINRDMRAINPKLSLYQVLSERRTKLETEIKELERVL